MDFTPILLVCCTIASHPSWFPFVTFFFVLLARIGFFFLVLDITSLCSSEILVIIFLVPMFLFLVSFFYLLIDRVVEDAGVG
jgi:hypothetical protein